MRGASRPPVRREMLPATRRARVGLAALLPLVAALFLGATHLTSTGAATAAEIVGMCGAAAGVYLVCTTEPVYLFTLAIVLTPFAGHWPQLHIPGPASPDRLLFTAGALIVLFRSYI